MQLLSYLPRMVKIPNGVQAIQIYYITKGDDNRKIHPTHQPCHRRE